MEDRHPPRFLESWLLGDGAKSNHPATNSESPVVTGSLGLKRRHKKAVQSARRHIAILAGSGYYSVSVTLTSVSLVPHLGR